MANGTPVELKSVFVAYFLWLFLGFTGWQNFYVGRKNLGCIELCLFICDIISFAIFGVIGTLFLIIPIAIGGILMLYDLFTLYYAVQDYNDFIRNNIDKAKMLR